MRVLIGGMTLLHLQGSGHIFLLPEMASPATFCCPLFPLNLPPSLVSGAEQHAHAAAHLQPPGSRDHLEREVPPPAPPHSRFPARSGPGRASFPEATGLVGGRPPRCALSVRAHLIPARSPHPGAVSVNTLSATVQGHRFSYVVSS